MHNGQRVDRFKALVQPAPVKLPSVLGVTLVLGTSPVVGDSGRCGTLQARCVAAAGDDPLSLRTRCWRSPNLAPITAARRRRRRDGHRNGGGLANRRLSGGMRLAHWACHRAWFCSALAAVCRQEDYL